MICSPSTRRQANGVCRRIAPGLTWSADCSVAHKPANRPGRRAFCALAVLAGAWPLARASASSDQLSYALTSPSRARALPPTPQAAQQIIEQARASLGRQPHYLPVVHTSGLLDGEGNRDASKLAQEDWRQCRLQALAFRLSGKREHADCAARYLATWAGPYRPSFNPIDETELASLLCGFDLVQDQLPTHLLDSVRNWCRPLARGYLAKQILNGAPSTAVNNWHSHRIKIATAAAFVSGDALLVEMAREEFLLQVRRNIAAGGKTFDFTQRDALHYVVYTLEPLLVAASMAAAHGHDWYGAAESEGRLRSALAWLQPYATGERTHDEFVHSTVGFDRKRASAGVRGFAGPWRRDEAATLYWLAAQLDPQFNGIKPLLSAPPSWVQALHSQRFY